MPLTPLSRAGSWAVRRAPRPVQDRLAQSVSTGRLAGSRYAGGVRRALGADGVDPTIETEVCGSRLVLPMSHSLPAYRRQDPSYSENLGEVARLVAAAGGTTMIDVGANVGDSATIVKAYAPGTAILCVDADERYLPFLQANTARWPDVEIAAPVLLAERSTEIDGTITGARGTSRFVTDTGEATPAVALDDLLATRDRFRTPALLKSDTDGFEDRVVRGAARTLAECGPVLFLEYDPKLMRAAGSDSLDLLSYLRRFDYEQIAFYDKFGTLMVRCSLADEAVLRDLDAYATANTPRGVDHYDIVVTTRTFASVVDGLPVRAALR